MKAISLIQPYATLIMLGLKDNETRSWSTTFRGPLAIHASAGKPAWAREVCETNPYIKAALARHGLTFDTLPRGAVLGTCQLRDVLKIVPPHVTAIGVCDPTNLSAMEQAAGDYTPGRWAWRLADVRVLPVPIPCKGSLQLWELPVPVRVQVLTA